MIQEEELLRKAKEAGFDNCRIISAEKLTFDHSLRKYCEINYAVIMGITIHVLRYAGRPRRWRRRPENSAEFWCFRPLLL